MNMNMQQWYFKKNVLSLNPRIYIYRNHSYKQFGKHFLIVTMTRILLWYIGWLTNSIDTEKQHIRNAVNQIQLTKRNHVLTDKLIKLFKQVI